MPTRIGSWLAFALFLPMPSFAATINYVTGIPDYAISSVELFSKGTTTTNDPSGFSYAGVRVNASYAADTLVPFPSQGGFAAVGNAGQTFDFTLTLTPFDDNPANTWDQLYVELNVLNDSGISWTDFHVEFYDAAFQNKLGMTLLQVGSGPSAFPYFANTLFDQSSTYGQYGGAELHFWSTTATQDPQESNLIGFRWDWGNPLGPYSIGDTVGIRVIATVPEPSTAVLVLVAAGAFSALFAAKRQSQ